MIKIAFVTGFLDTRYKYREEIYFIKLEENGLVPFLYTSYFSPPQKGSAKTHNLISTRHYRVKHFFKWKDIVIFPVFLKLRKIQPDIIHVFDAQQLSGIGAFIYSRLYSVPFIYEHELRETPSSFFGKVRFFCLTRPLIKLYIKSASFIRTVTPSASQLLKNIAGNSIELDNRLVETTLSYSMNVSSKYYNGNKSFERKLSIGFSGKIDNKKYAILLSLLKEIPKINSEIQINFMIDFNGHQKNEILEIFKNKKNYNLIFVGLLEQKCYYDMLSQLDGIIFFSPSISYFEAIGCHLPILIKNDESSSHLLSDNIFKYDNDNFKSKFLSYITSVKSFFYAADKKFSDDFVTKCLIEQYVQSLKKK